MIVVDSAAVVDALTAVEGSEDLRAHLASEELHAPALLDFEIVSALRGLTLGGQLSAARAEDALTDFEDLPVQRWPSGDALRRRVFSLRDNLNAHDAAYCLRGRRRGIGVCTADPGRPSRPLRRAHRADPGPLTDCQLAGLFAADVSPIRPARRVQPTPAGCWVYEQRVKTPSRPCFTRLRHSC